MNKSILTGNLGGDAEVKETNDKSRKFIFFNLANSEKSKNGYVTTWYKCYIQNDKLVESKLIDYLKKGSKVLIEGKISAKNWTKDDGTIMLDMVFNIYNLESNSSNQNNNEPPSDIRYQENTNIPIENAPIDNRPIEVKEAEKADDLPF